MNHSEIFNNSYERIKQKNDEFLTLFLESLVAKDEAINNMFTGVDIESHKMKLDESLADLIMYYISQGTNASISKLADNHKHVHGVTPVMYDHFMESIIEAISKIDDKFDSGVEQSWRITLGPGIEFMKNY